MMNANAKRDTNWWLCVTACIGLVACIGLIKNSFAQTVNGVDMANYFRNACIRSFSSASSASSEQGPTDFQTVCNGVSRTQGNVPADFYDNMSPEDFEAFKLDALLFAQTENNSAMDRMQALRRSKQNGNSTALDLNVNGSSLFGAAQHAVSGGGASADDASGLLGKSWGLWMRFNSAKGDKDVTALTGSLETKQAGFAVGADRRLGANSVIGMSLGSRDSKAKFGPNSAQGGMDGNAWSVSAYGSSFVFKDLYVDTVVNYGKINYETRRTVFDLSTERTASGSPSGTSVSAGAAVGYDLAMGGLTITPSINYFYVDSRTDAFQETGAGGLDLSFGKQHYHSSTAHVDLDLAYAINSSAGVWLPHVRTQWVKEFADQFDTFDVRFVNDPDPTATPLAVQLDKLDKQYFRVAAGMSAQFRNDISAYVDYQQLVGFDAVSFHNISLGFRVQF